MSRPPLGRLAAFVGVTVGPALAGLVLMTALARAVPADAWASVALGQSVGLLGSLVAGFGWALNGPGLVAAADDAVRRGIYAASLRTRAWALVAVLPVGAGVTLLLVPDSARLLGVAVFAASSLMALSPRWYLVGTGRALDVLKYDAGPVAAANLVSGVAVAAGAEPVVYPAALALAAAGSVLGFGLSRRGPTGPLVDHPVAGQWRPALTEAVGGVYSTVNVALVSTQVSVVALAGYASGWKVYQWGMVVLVGVGQALQGWVAAEHSERTRRFRTSLLTHAVLGALGCAAFVLVGGPLTELLFGAVFRAPEDVLVGLGVATLFLSLNTSLGRHVLATAGNVRAILTSTALGAAIGVPLILALSARHGASGGAAALAMTEGAVLLYQAAAARPLLRGS